MENADELISFLKENEVIENDPRYKYKLIDSKGIDAEEHSNNKAIYKSLLCAVILVIATVCFACYSLWTLIVFVPLTLLSIIRLLLYSIGFSLTQTNGGTTNQRKELLENYLGYSLNDDFKYLCTSSKDYGDTVFFPSKNDFEHICKLVVPENETVFRKVYTNMKPGDVCGWRHTIEIYVQLGCIRLTTVDF